MQQTIKDEAAMERLGRRMGEAVRGGEVIELVGDVGTGKTTLTRAVARGMGITEPIQSPTFTIQNHYKAPGGLELAHYDFYRLNDAGIMREELAETAADTAAVTVVEWGEIVTGVLPEDRLVVKLAHAPSEARSLSVQAHGPQSRQLMERLS